MVTFRQKLCELPSLPFYGFKIFAAAMLVLLALAIFILIPGTHLDSIPATVDPKSEPPDNSPAHWLVAVYFGGSILVLAILVAVISFFVYLFSKDKTRSRKAGGVFKTAFGFLLTTGGGVMTYLGFSK